MSKPAITRYTNEDFKRLAHMIMNMNLELHFMFGYLSVPKEYQDSESWGREAELLTDDNKHFCEEDFNRDINLKDCKFRKVVHHNYHWMDDDTVSLQFQFEELDSDDGSYVEMHIKIEQIEKFKLRLTHIDLLIDDSDEEYQTWECAYPEFILHPNLEDFESLYTYDNLI